MLIQDLLQDFRPAALIGSIGVRVPIAEDAEDLPRFRHSHKRALKSLWVIRRAGNRLPKQFRVWFTLVIGCDMVLAPVVSSCNPHRLHGAPVVHDTKSNKDASRGFQAEKNESGAQQPEQEF